MSFNNEKTPARSADGQRLILKQHETDWWATAKNGHSGRPLPCLQISEIDWCSLPDRS